MAAPLSGVGQQQQVPLSQPFQPGGSDQTREIRQKEQSARDTEIQAPGAAAARSQDTNHTQNSGQDRGSVVDIVI